MMAHSTKMQQLALQVYRPLVFKQEQNRRSYDWGSAIKK